MDSDEGVDGGAGGRQSSTRADCKAGATESRESTITAGVFSRQGMSDVVMWHMRGLCCAVLCVCVRARVLKRCEARRDAFWSACNRKKKGYN